RDRPRCRASAGSPELVLGMVCLDHSANGDDRMRLSHNTLVSNVAVRSNCTAPVWTMSASGQKRICAVQEARSALPSIATTKADLCGATRYARRANSGLCTAPCQAELQIGIAASSVDCRLLPDGRRSPSKFAGVLVSV